MLIEPRLHPMSWVASELSAAGSSPDRWSQPDERSRGASRVFPSPLGVGRQPFYDPPSFGASRSCLKIKREDGS